MEHIIRILTFALIPVIVRGVLAFMRRPKKPEEGKVYLPKFMLILGLITSIFFLIPTFITSFSDEPVWIPIIFFAFSLLGGVLIIAFVNCRISYDPYGFDAKNFFGKKKSYTYDQVTAIKINTHEVYLYMDKSRVAVDEFSIGGNDFLNFVEQKYKELHNGKDIPSPPKSKHDIFNGNVKDVGSLLFAYILVSVVCIAFLGVTVWSVFFRPNTAENTTAQQVTFLSCTVADDKIQFRDADQQLYQINNVDAQFDATALTKICDGETAVTAYWTKATPEDAEEYYSVKAILHGESYLLSFDETNRWNQQANQSILLFPAIFLLVWWAYIAGAIVVGRNPQKFSKKVIRIFFKDEQIK